MFRPIHVQQFKKPEPVWSIRACSDVAYSPGTRSNRKKCLDVCLGLYPRASVPSMSMCGWGYRFLQILSHCQIPLLHVFPENVVYINLRRVRAIKPPFGVWTEDVKQPENPNSSRLGLNKLECNKADNCPGSLCGIGKGSGLCR